MTIGAQFKIPSTTTTSTNKMEGTRMVQRSMSAGVNMRCLPIEILIGTTYSPRDVEENSGLVIGGE